MYSNGTYNYMQAKAIQNDLMNEARQNAMIKEAKSGQAKHSLRTNIGLTLIKLGQRVAQAPRLQEA